MQKRSASGVCVHPGVDLQAIDATPARKPTIAVVDDDTAVLRALERFIRSRGATPKLYSSPAEFIQSVGATPPDCLILDVQMPGMSGLELHYWLQHQGFSIPVIFITAHEDPEAEAQARDAGAAGFFYKPFQNGALWAAILDTLSARKPG